MQYMEIKIDEEKIVSDGKYELQSFWESIDKALQEAHCIKKRKHDGALIYWGNPQYDNYLSYFGLGYIRLRHAEWFARYVTKWIWADNDDEEALPYSEEDLVAKEKKDNELFRAVAI